MDLSLPIRSVVPSLDGPVLAALASTTAPASLTQVHDRAARGSLSGVRKVLQRLVVHGIVHDGPAGYTLNHEHLAASAILLLAQLHGEVATRIRQWLADRPEDVVASGLFGSAARRDGDVDSDIDVVVLTASPAGPDLADGLADALERWTGNRGQVVVLTPDEARMLRDQGRAIVDAWRRDLQMLVGDRSEVLG
ncbi:MAG: nucleotidyltransferase domain-containing protein [Actinobacteria bacterium]|nr:nucleotidyltransferase domain-containing protein [Actinomycetota bacterium]